MKMVASLETGSDEVPFLRVGHEVLRLDLEALNEECLEKSALELRETPENSTQAIVRLRQLLEGEKGLNIPIDDDEYLLKFLRPCKFYPESTLRLINRYYSFKAKNPKYCQELTPKEVRKVFVENIILFLPTRCPGGERVMVVNPGKNWNPKTVSITDIIRAVVMVVEVAMIEPRTQVGGVHIILDMKGLSLSHVTQFSPKLAQLILEFVQGCAPIRLKTINIINQPFIFNMLYAVFKPFIGEKLRKRIFFHGTNWEALHERIPPKCLSEDYEGAMLINKFPGDLLADLLEMYESDFEEMNTYGYINAKVKPGSLRKEQAAR